ncbi:TetR/AcrR family transcriptional regulator [Streptomyces sp. F8]|uniref:TetR/AcrR family transcriptional regulator n=1 Tax=Streptomyces sp. F8 TaxID=1436085 RepID=UPI0029CB52AD|nr:TetR/AcrR family transcriptional regulator [Streptomyces sp. F8]MDX6759125.1 TetR/AcrR family transcriptional regulator [Streptomyces sp. F8]
MISSSARRGRPRDARSDAAIADAVAALLAESGYAAMSIGAVATRAGVGKDTIYRRWSGKAELVYETVFTTADTADLPDTGTLEGDLTAVVQSLVEEFSEPAAAAALPGLLADFAAVPELRAAIRSRFLAPAKERLAAVFDRAARRGETDSGVPADLALDTLAGAVFFHLGIMGEQPDPDLAARIAAMIVKGIEVR